MKTAIITQVWDQVSEKIWNQVTKRFHRSVSTKVWAKVQNEFESVNEQVEDQVGVKINFYCAIRLNNR